MLIGLGILALLALLIATKSFKIVGQAEVLVIERLGKFNRLARSGFNVLIPFIERPRPIDVRYFEADVNGVKKITSGSTSRIDLREQVLNFPSQPVITKDNVTIDIDAVLYYRIADPQKATYSIQNLPYAPETLTRTTLSNIVGDMELDQTLASRDLINKKMREVIEEASIGWGVDVTRVELQAIEPPRDIQQSMELVMRAERERRAAVTNAEASKRAAILESEGQREAQVRKAEGEKEAAVLRAQGLAEARLAMANAEAEAIQRIARPRRAPRRGACGPAGRHRGNARPGRDVPPWPQMSRGPPARRPGHGVADFPSCRGHRSSRCARWHEGAAREGGERCRAVARRGA